MRIIRILKRRNRHTLRTTSWNQGHGVEPPSSLRCTAAACRRSRVSPHPSPRVLWAVTVCQLCVGRVCRLRTETAENPHGSATHSQTQMQSLKCNPCSSCTLAAARMNKPELGPSTDCTASPYRQNPASRQSATPPQPVTRVHKKTSLPSSQYTAPWGRAEPRPCSIATSQC